MHGRRWAQPEVWHGLHDRVTGAQLRILQDPVNAAGLVDGGKGVAYAFAAMAVDDADALRRQFLRRVDDVGKQRLACKRMQHLGQVRMHPLSLAGSEYDDIHGTTTLPQAS